MIISYFMRWYPVTTGKELNKIIIWQSYEEHKQGRWGTAPRWLCYYLSTQIKHHNWCSVSSYFHDPTDCWCQGFLVEVVLKVFVPQKIIFFFLWYWRLNPGPFYLWATPPALFYFLFWNKVLLGCWESCHVAEAILEQAILLSQPPKYWDYKHAPKRPASALFLKETL